MVVVDEEYEYDYEEVKGEKEERLRSSKLVSFYGGSLLRLWKERC